MKLEYSLLGENEIGMNQIQMQLANLTLQLQDINKGKEHHEEVWCTRCHTYGHTKDNYLDYRNYLLLGVPNPLSCGSVPWCHIF